MRKFFLLSAMIAFSPLWAAGTAPVLSSEQIRAEVRLGDLAIEKGDFDNAVDYFASALKRPGLDRQMRGDILLKLIRARLYGGEVEIAAKLMKQFESEYPERYAGLLQGEILQKTGRTKEAQSFFSSLFGSADNAAEKSEILYRLAEVEIAAGDYKQARERLDQLLAINDENWVPQAKLTRVFVMIRDGKYQAAAQELDAFDAENKIPPGGDFRSRSLRLLLNAEIGDVEKFLPLWAEFCTLYAPVGNQIVAEAVGKVAQQLVKAGKNSEAEQLFESSLNWQLFDSERQDVMRNIMALQTSESGNADAAADTAENYCRIFPNADDRIDMIYRAADKLFSAGKFDRALEFYMRVGNDAATPKKSAASALRNAVIVAEKLGKTDLEKTIYRNLIKLDSDVVEMRKDQINFGAFLYNIGENDEAIKVLEPISADESAARLLTQAAISAGEKAIARRVAAQLSNSNDPQSAGFGLYYQGKLAEEEGDFSGARNDYLLYVKKYGADGPFADEAGFRAALLAWKSGIDATASELEAFAKADPKSANAPNALLVAIQSKAALGEAQTTFDLLLQNYPDSPELKRAVPVMLQRLIQNRDRAGFFALLDKSEKWFSEVDESAEFGFIKLYGIDAFDGAAAADSYGNELMQKYPTADIAPEIAYFCGGIQVALKKYEKARECFQRAAELRPTGRLFFCAKGREADMELELSLANKDESALERAKNIYQMLREKSRNADSETNIESIYKLAFCRELGGAKHEAVKLYEDVLYVASDMRRRGIALPEVWCVKAVCRAVRILIEQRRSG